MQPSPSHDAFARLLAIDAVLIKAAALGTDAVFANMERRLSHAINLAWMERVDRAVLAVRANAMYGMAAKDFKAAIRKAFKGWEKALKSPITAVTRDAYQEGKRHILGQALKRVNKSVQLVSKAPRDPSLETSFTLVDEKAVDQLIDGQLHWVGEYYDSQLSESIDDMVNQTMFQTGLGRAEAGKLLEAKLLERLATLGASIPEGWGKGPAAYFELIAANTASNARVRGSLGQMLEIGVSKYTISAAGDERTCDRCAYMDGKTVEVKHAARVLDEISDADSPDEVKRLHPWANTVEQMKDAPGKFIFPPFHGECRCTVDIAEDSEITFEPFEG